MTKLEQLVDEFSREMLEKLQGKKQSGWSGWNNKRRFSDATCRTRLLEHLGRALEDPGQWPDVANFCAFLWWRTRKKPLRPESLDEPA